MTVFATVGWRVFDDAVWRCLLSSVAALARCPVPVRQEIVVELVPEMIYRVRTTEPLSPTDGSPFGPRQYWQVSEASLDGGPDPCAAGQYRDRLDVDGP